LKRFRIEFNWVGWEEAESEEEARDIAETYSPDDLMVIWEEGDLDVEEAEDLEGEE